MDKELEQILSTDKLIIYGARLAALECIRWLIRSGKKNQIVGLAVTNTEGNPKEMLGFSVKNLEEYKNHDLTVIIAMHEKYHTEVEEYARRKGFYKFIRIGFECMSKIKLNYLISEQERYNNINLLLQEDINDHTWLNILELNADNINFSDEMKRERYYKFPTLFYLDEDTVFAEADKLDFKNDYEKICGEYRNLHMFPISNIERLDAKELINVINIYMAFSAWDNAKIEFERYAPWIMPIQLGSKLSNQRRKSLYDDMGNDNISEYNRVLAEMTGAYWIWKNSNSSKYKGLCHYRRHFIISEEEIMSLDYNNIDVILATPRYAPGGLKDMFLTATSTSVTEEVYERILCSISELFPDDRDKFEEYSKSCFYYPNNMVVARNDIYNNYCEWIFPILFRTLEKDAEVCYKHMNDRHIAYAAELLTSYYFVKNKDKYKIAVTDYKFYS